MRQALIGNLTWDSLPHEWFTIGGTVAFLLLAVVVIVALTWTKRWKWLWKEWLTSVDPKKIGIMYFIAGGAMLLRGGLDAIMIWLQQALSSGSSHGYLSSDHFQQIFTAHGNIMVFFVAMALIFGFVNYIVPLQIGARDLARTAGSRRDRLYAVDGGDPVAGRSPCACRRPARPGGCRAPVQCGCCWHLRGQ